MRIILTFVFSLLFLGDAFAAQAPLLQEGKKTLYQRIITHPHAQILQNPDPKSAVIQNDVKPFSVFYVFAKQKDNTGQDAWLQVGAVGGPALGWVEAKKTTAWNQSLTLLLTPRSGRDPLLFFRTEQDLNTLCTASDMEAQLVNIHKNIAENKDSGNTQIIATEPIDSKGAVSAERFYLMPILNMTDPFEGVKFLEVASIDPGHMNQNNQAPTKPRTAIAFVIDTTISMKPYIDQSLNVIKEIYDQLQNDKLTEDVAFGVVAFRNSLKSSPDTEYESLVISDFATALERESLETELAKVQEATKSTHSFAENSPSGIKLALDSLSWNDYTSRMLIVISDAGPIPHTDPNATVKMDMPELGDYARSKGVWISSLHIKSPRGKADHASAEKAYRMLTKLSDNRSNYLSIPAETPEEGAKNFASVSKALTSGIVNMVKMTLEGKLVTKPKDEPSTKQTPANEAASLAQALGYAMQLEYLGKLNANRAPSIVDSWIADMDLQKLAKGSQVPTVEVAVLLTKNQLSDLSQQLNIIIDNAERTKKTDARDFFQGILSASTKAARDPNSPAPQGKNLAELGVLAEFLEGLPYKSDIMLLREDDWYRMSIGQQTAFINRLKSRLARYEEYDKDRSNWESFGAVNAGDWVYRVPLTMLP